MLAPELVLRDVHVPPAPGLWPPAPGWWLVAGAVVLCAAIAGFLGWRRRQKLRSWQHAFDSACIDPSPTAQIAGISELLRRAARGVDPKADRLQGEAWLGFLDGEKCRDFSEGPGRLLLEGGYRRELPDDSFDRTKALARARFVQLMAARK